MAPNPNAVIKKVVEAARAWLRSRAKLRKAMSDKVSEKIVERLKRAHIGDSHKLEAAVTDFEKLFNALRSAAPGKKASRPRPFPWKRALDVASVGLGALNKFVNDQPAPEFVKATVIDDDEGRPVM